MRWCNALGILDEHEFDIIRLETEAYQNVGVAVILHVILQNTEISPSPRLIALKLVECDIVDDHAVDGS